MSSDRPRTVETGLFWKGLKILADANKERVSLMPHAGERGRLFEGVASALVRSILPLKFSIGTGVIVNGAQDASSQIDLVVFDEQQNVVLRLGDSNLFMIETVYAAIEIKATLDSEELEKASSACAKIRAMAQHKTYSTFTREKYDEGKYVVKTIERKSTLAPRFYLIAFNSDLSINTLENQLKAFSKRDGSYFHGVYVLGRDWFLKQRPHRDPPEFKISEDERALPALIKSMHGNIVSYRMRPAYVKSYLGESEPDESEPPQPITDGKSE